jgi:hypothetical protein
VCVITQTELRIWTRPNGLDVESYYSSLIDHYFVIRCYKQDLLTVLIPAFSFPVSYYSIQDATRRLPSRGIGLVHAVTASEPLRLEINLRTTGWKWKRVWGHAEEELWHACDHKEEGQHWSRYVQECYLSLTMPPITNNPATERIKSRIGTGSTAPLQSSRIDEEAVSIATRRGTAITSIDADRLPGVSCVAYGHTHSPVFLVSSVFPKHVCTMDDLPGKLSAQVELLKVVRGFGSRSVSSIEETSRRD